MKRIADCAPVVWKLVNCLVDELELRHLSRKEAEEKVLQFVYRLDALMIEEIVDRVSEPTLENQIYVDGMVARYRETAKLRPITRFGREVVRKSRRHDQPGTPSGRRSSGSRELEATD